jgi:hypothetical protein
MILLAIVSILVGALLGLRFRVFILVPAITFALALVIGVGVAREAGIWWIALEMVVVATALQLGYLGGSAFAATRATHSGEELQTSAEMPGFDSKPVTERPPEEEQQPPSKSGINLR